MRKSRAHSPVLQEVELCLSARTEARAEGGRGVSTAGRGKGGEREEGKAIPGLRKLIGGEGDLGPQPERPPSFSPCGVGKTALFGLTQIRDSVQGRFWVTAAQKNTQAGLSWSAESSFPPSFKFEIVRAEGSTL